ncbi:acyltransferase family protein [Abyssicoccus albus]|uniref:Peptidoglycan/LPS O-acetylase OafA/YrhL n=1 Tax=Abyssicoccus albus TaxID=1817405 RepID=A0A3N5BIE6_9BACL|nr:acyltransferase family protein [Abyssicoccus albus]RPF57596.1 peptidoglycan/LPS O-acetylase OafA/YrhL [Abyssicoccus albus]
MNQRISDSKNNNSITGLIGLSIIFIVLYHLNRTVFSGGFFGVDVLLVIAGYLHTNYLLRINGHQGHQINEKMSRYMLRYLPTLMIVIVATLIIFSLMQYEPFHQLRNTALSMIFIVPNWYMIQYHDGYFDAYILEPLVHLFALGVLLQCVVIWTFICRLLFKFKSHLKAMQAIAFLMIISASAMPIVFLTAGVSRSFLGTDTRLQTFLMGALVAFISQQFNTSRFKFRYDKFVLPVVTILMVVLLIISFMTAKTTNILLYFGGTFIFSLIVGVLIWSITIRDNNIGQLIFKFKPLVLLGKRAFPLYMWHMPIIVLIRSIGFNHSIIEWLIAIIAISVLTELTYRKIQRPIEKLGFKNAIRSINWQKFIRPALIICLLILFIVSTVYINSFFKDDIKDYSSSNTEIIKDEIKLEKPEYRNVNMKKINYLYIGDGFSNDVVDQLKNDTPNLTTDVEVNRSGTGLSRILANHSEFDQRGEVMVIQLGGTLKPDLESVEDFIINHPHQHIFLINLRGNKEYSREINESYYALTNEYDNTYLIDWNYEVNTNDDYFDEESGQLNRKGKKAYSNLISKSIQIVLEGQVSKKGFQ